MDRDQTGGTPREQRPSGAKGGARRVRVAIAGVSGRMGREVLAAVQAEPDLTLVGAVSRRFAGTGGGLAAGSALEADLRSRGVATFAETKRCLEATSPDVLVEFTSSAASPGLILAALEGGVRPVSGTTGMPPERLLEIGALAAAKRLGAVVIPNFSVGATVLRILARTAAPFFGACEVVELHHDQKRDAPSGTALALAEVVGPRLRRIPPLPVPALPAQGAPGSDPRGLAVAGVPVHSVRLPGLVAHHELIFGATDETLTLRHDSLSRVSFMPGVLLAVRAVMRLSGLVTSLEDLLADHPDGPSGARRTP